MIVHLLVLLVSMAAGLQATAQTPAWSQFADSPAATTRHDDICFITVTNGWSARGRDGIYKTDNGGKTWLKKLTNSATHFRSIGFLSEQVGFAGNLGPGSYDANVTDTNLLYRTLDGGETWSVVPAINQTDMKGFCALYVLDAQHIYGGGRVRGPAHFVKSEDGGNTWFVTNLTSAGIMGGIMDVYFKDPMNGFVVGMGTNAYNTTCVAPYYHGAIARTTNGGLSWSVVATTPINCTYFWKMSWPTPEVGYVSLQQNVNANTLVYYKTLDGGETWNSHTIPCSAIGITSFHLLQGIGFVTPDEGWVGGPGSTAVPFSDTFLHTTNGGASWKPVGYDDTHAINRIRVYPNFAVASGAKLHVYRVPLSIGVQPQDATNTMGSTATLAVTAYGTHPLNFQWRLNGININGATTNVYTVTNAQAEHAGNYDVIIRDYTGSVTSSVATLTLDGLPPVITGQPRSRITGIGGNVAFSVTATSSATPNYQWFFNNTLLAGATSATLTRTNTQLSDAGNYFVVLSNPAGSTTSEVATLTVIPETAFFFTDDFDGYSSPVTITSAGTNAGYKILFGADSGAQDFKVVVGFDYSTVSLPTTIPPSPNSGGTTKGLYLAVNKDGNPNAAAINLYPFIAVSNNFSLKLDMWQNYWTNIGSASEHALFGINHSGSLTNRVQWSGSDGLFFAINCDGNVSGTATAIRDFSVFRGGGVGANPVLMLTNNTVFGPTPPLGMTFDNANAGFVSLFPSRPISGYPNTPQGSPGLRWVSVEVRHEYNLITCLLNGVAIAQYTNIFGYTNGTVMIGYNDTFDSLGSTNNFVIFDNVRVERFFPTAAKLMSPLMSGDSFTFTFESEAYALYSIQRTATLIDPNWITQTNVVGNGTIKEVTVPLGGIIGGQQYFRVTRP